jgi:hypothetical protein
MRWFDGTRFPLEVSHQTLDRDWQVFFIETMRCSMYGIAFLFKQDAHSEQYCE